MQSSILALVEKSIVLQNFDNANIFLLHLCPLFQLTGE